MSRSVGNYILGPLIGRGAMSEVYAGEHRFLGDAVAIKLMRADTAEATAAFVAEATRTRAIEHRNVVRVLDVGHDEDSRQCYLVMERVDGENLATHAARLGALDEARVRALGAAIADGMQAAHERGIVHRDLKPANVMLSGDDVKVVDFGIARHLEGASATSTGRRVGTPAYMAPEQMTGGLIAPCVDIWALGVMLFELATGRLPFSGFEGGRAPQLSENAPRARAHASVSPTLDALIARCLEREPGLRPVSMAAIAAELRADGADDGHERITDHLGSAVAPAPPPIAPVPPAPARARLWPWLAAGAAVAAAIAVVSVRSCDDAAPAAHAGPGDAGARTAAPVSPADAAAAVAATADAAAPTRADRRIELRTTPVGAHVLHDGALVGITPARLDLETPITLTLRKPGYRPERVVIEHGGPVEVRLRKRRASRPPRSGPRRGKETLD